MVIGIFFTITLTSSSSFYMSYQREKNFSPYPFMIAALLAEINKDPVAAIDQAMTNPQLLTIFLKDFTRSGFQYLRAFRQLEDFDEFTESFLAQLK